MANFSICAIPRQGDAKHMHLVVSRKSQKRHGTVMTWIDL